MKTFLFRSFIGIFFGAFLSVLTTYAIFFFGDVTVFQADPFIKNSLGSMFCGWFFSVTPLLFEIESWSLFRQTAVHFLIVTCLFFPLSAWVGWMPFTLTSLLFFIAVFLVLYGVIWLGFYLYFRHESRKLNQQLEHIE
ncbi:DUF3021 domain-containing protein [Halobacillus sp. ACCC02827]|uniref:DUF3021 domain-containing protein n=1 Tax=Bacillaceae TaxID=186817 RepID=UPI000429246A|nr:MULTISPECIES: DUF3021 domain-containing protein [Bacillaceae]QHT46184.1 DUF3021 domain-containing protein [Bacillus sp. SB49]WJE17000.1 DUF3021 domain-containing protein [Halobacillus sp. ACCC02827]